MRYLGMPAGMWALFAMSEAGGHDFVRAYTLASGGPYCDCGYKRKERNER